MSVNPPKKNVASRVVRGTSRAGIGGGALLIGLALYLLFRGFGPGGTGASGSGTGSETDSAGKTMISTGSPSNGSPSNEDGATTAVAAPDKIQGGLSEDEQKALSGSTLTVLIDEHDYLIELPGTPVPLFRPASLERIVELANIAKGDTNGTKIRILRRQSSRASAEEKLKLELKRKGVGADAIVMPGEFVP